MRLFSYHHPLLPLPSHRVLFKLLLLPHFSPEFERQIRRFEVLKKNADALSEEIQAIEALNKADLDHAESQN